MLKLGDVFVIDTKIGIAYLQYVSDTEDNGELIRVLPGLYSKYESFSDSTLQLKERYFLHFPLRYAYKKKVIKYIGNYNIPNNVIIPKYFRSETINPKTGNISWYIYEDDTCKMKKVDKLTDDILSLSDWSVWNDTLLKERLEDNWSLENWY